MIGDTTLRTIQSQLRNTLSATLGGLGGSSLKTLGQAGIAFQRDGTLAIDSAKLSAALNGQRVGDWPRCSRRWAERATA